MDSEELKESSPEPETAFDDEHEEEANRSYEEISIPEDPPRHLIEPNVESEIIGTLMFNENFGKLYGSCYPLFAVGSLEETIKETITSFPKEGKLMAIYLHDDHSILSNVFCSQILCDPEIVTILNANFDLWGWDVTDDSNREMFINSLKNVLGSCGDHYSEQIDKIQVDFYPIFLVVLQVHSTLKLEIIHASHLKDTTIDNLLTVLETYKMQTLSLDEKR